MRRLLTIAMVMCMALPALAGRRGAYEFSATSTSTIYTLDDAARHLEIKSDAEVNVRAWLTTETPSTTFDGEAVLIPAGGRIFKRSGTGYQAITLQATTTANVSVTALR